MLRAIVVTRMLTALYSVCLLGEFVAFAMALVGKTLYMQSVLRGNARASSDDTAAANRLLMTIGARFIQNGTLLLAESLRNATSAVLAKLPLHEPLTPTLLAHLLAQIRHEVETVCGRSVVEDSLFGRLDEIVSADLPSLRRRLFIEMVTETRRWIRSDHVKSLLSTHITHQLEHIYHQAFSSTPPQAAPSKATETGESTTSSSTTTTTLTLPLVTLIPRLGRSFHLQFASHGTASAFEGQVREVAVAVFAHSGPIAAAMLSAPEA